MLQLSRYANDITDLLIEVSLAKQSAYLEMRIVQMISNNAPTISNTTTHCSNDICNEVSLPSNATR